jgi:phage-related protein
MISFIINGQSYSFSTFSFVPLSVEGTGVAPVTNIYRELLLGGAEYKGTMVNDRVLTVAGRFTCGVDFETEQRAMADLTTLLANQKVTLVSDGKRIDAYYAGGLEGNTSSQDNGEAATLRFVALQPYWSATATQSATLGSEVSLTNGGDGEAYPTIVLGGPGLVTSITNATIGNTLGFSGLTLVAGETLTIALTPTTKSIISSVKGNCFGYLLPNSLLSSFRLIPDVNTIQTAMAGTITTKTISWVERYWGAAL